MYDRKQQDMQDIHYSDNPAHHAAWRSCPSCSFFEHGCNEMDIMSLIAPY